LKQAARAKRPDNEDDPASVFDVDTHAPQQDIHVEASFPDEAEKSAGSGLIDLQSVLAQFEEEAPKPVDDDMVHLSGNLFGGSGSAPLVAPDLASLVSSPPSKSSASSRGTPSIKALDDVAPVPALLAPVMTLEQAAQKKSVRPKAASKPGVAAPNRVLHVAVWILGLGICGAAAYGAFQLAIKKPASDKPPAVAQQNVPKPEDEPLGAPRRGEPEGTSAESAPAQGDAPKAGATKPAVAQAGPASGKPAPGAQVGAPAAPGAAEPQEAAPEPPAPAEDPAVARQAALAAALAAAPTATNIAGPARAPTPASGGQFDTGAARASLNAAAGGARACKQEGDPSGSASVSITFAPSGRVTSAKVQGPPFAGTATGGCIASAFRSATVPPFEGSPVTVNKTVSIR
jgi:hypothetical protein